MPTPITKSQTAVVRFPLDRTIAIARNAGTLHSTSLPLRQFPDRWCCRRFSCSNLIILRPPAAPINCRKLRGGREISDRLGRSGPGTDARCRGVSPRRQGLGTVRHGLCPDSKDLAGKHMAYQVRLSSRDLIFSCLISLLVKNSAGSRLLASGARRSFGHSVSCSPRDDFGPISSRGRLGLHRSSSS